MRKKFSRDVAILEVHIPSSDALETVLVEKSDEFEKLGLIGQCSMLCHIGLLFLSHFILGGTFGLFCGLSFVGALEIVYWCSKLFLPPNEEITECGSCCCFKSGIPMKYALASSLHGLKYIVMVSLLSM